MAANSSTDLGAMRGHPLASTGRDPRFALMQRHNKIKKVEQTKFLGAAPRSAKECHLALPCNAVAEDIIDETDPTTNKMIAQIRSKYNVWVKINRADHFVTLSGENLKSLNLAKDALRVFLVGINQEVQNRMIILTHLSVATNQATVELRLLSGDDKLYRPVALARPIEEDLIYLSDVEEGDNKINNDTVSQHGLDGHGAENALDIDAALGNLVDQFSAAVQETGKRLRPVAGELRVRAHMGVFAVKKRQSKTNKYESDEALKRFLSVGADRGYVFVNHRLGNESWAARMLEIIYGTEDLDHPTSSQFMAADSADISIRDIKPNFTLVMFAKDLKIEVDITHEPKYRSRPETGSVRAFSCNRDKVAEIAISCPNRKFDWHLSVEAETPKSQIPVEVLELIDHGLKFKPLISTKPGVNDEFLLTEIDKYLLRAASIDNVACKVFWTFQTTDTPYYLEVSVYHEWGAGFLEKSNPTSPWKILNTAAVPRPIKSCGVSFYGHEWDHKIRDINKPGGGRQADFSNGFPELFVNEDFSPSIKQFLQEMERLHDLTELASVTEQI